MHHSWPPPTTVAAAREAPDPATRWWSVPVLCCAVIAVPALVGSFIFQPAASALCLVPAAAVLAVVAWLDRVEPEPLAVRVHAFLFGALVAGLIAGIINTVVLLTAGTLPALVISAPVCEEVLKGFGVYWVTRRTGLRTVLDGVIYAGLVAAGFALAENVEYFTAAATDGTLPATFLARGLLTPFAHPLFTLWTGLSIGLASSRQRHSSILRWAGLPVAITLHAMWNYTAWVTGENLSSSSGVRVIAFFIALFIATGIGLLLTRCAVVRSQQRGIGRAVLRYNLTPVEHATFLSYRSTRLARQTLSRQARRSFDAWHAAVLRLVDAARHDNTARDAVLLEALHAARAKHQSRLGSG
jgi:RsiW-degrading membrane proteinase PrsW (M82 family)